MELVLADDDETVAVVEEDEEEDDEDEDEDEEEEVEEEEEGGEWLFMVVPFEALLLFEIGVAKMFETGVFRMFELMAEDGAATAAIAAIAEDGVVVTVESNGLLLLVDGCC